MTSIFTDSASLTKIITNPGQGQVRHDLRDVHRMHQMLTRLACPPDFGTASRSAAGLLYRVEHTTVGISLLVQSRTTIDPERLSAGYAYGGTRDLGVLLDRLDSGSRVRYRMVANPTKQELLRGQRGVLRPLVDDAALAWWERKAAEIGLAVDAAGITDTSVMQGIRTTGGRQHKVVLTTSTFDGAATVHDPAAVREAILNGVGRGRAYGCGLLSVALLG